MASGDPRSRFCASARNCVVTGFAVFGRATRAFTRYEVNGTWGKVNALPGAAALDKGDFSTGDQVSCASAGNCALAGEYGISGGSAPFVAISSPATSTSLRLSAGKVAERLIAEASALAGDDPAA